MERQHSMKNWLSPKPILMLLILAPLLIQSMTIISVPCSAIMTGVPKISPQIDIGGYDSIPNPILESKRDIFIYWKAIKINKTCDGDQFKYRAFYEVVTRDNTIELIESNSTHTNHAQFIGLKTAVGYNFRVYSVNKYGRSKVYSKIYVPHSTEVRFLNPLTLQKSKILGESGFNLTWKYSGDYSDQLNNYTLFWCENYRHFPSQCNGDLNWIHLDSSESHYYFTVPDWSKSYTFAISANGHSLYDIEKGIDQEVFMSGGMVWASCNYLDYTDSAFIQKIWISDIGLYRLGLRWKMDCMDDTGFITDYIIYYYSIGPYGYTDVIKKTIKPKITDNAELVHQEVPSTFIYGLLPNTSYIINIKANTISQKALYSLRVVGTTKPATKKIYMICQ